ncbi:SHQ1 protein-domain-containing protein [Russula vinacea]|nr:SHQ1 protein-domain-containing protein [Russula vinacea]
MITPRFSCSQNDRSVIVSAYCPAVRASEIEIHVDDTLLSLHCPEDDHSSAVYEPVSGYLTLTLTKLNRGETFSDLDLLGKLLAPPAQSTPHNVTIEVLDSQDDSGHPMTSHPTLRNTVPESPDPLPPLETSRQKPYGFLNAYTGYFLHVGTTENEINELGVDAETLIPSERRIRRLRHEESKWDPGHYIRPSVVVFTEAENAAMLRLPRKEYLASPQETHNLYLTLLTFLFAYAYDARTTQHDPTPESAWTIAALTPAFSALDPPPYSSHHHPLQRARGGDFDFDSAAPHELAETLIPSYRRAIAFPLYRSWVLADACRADVAHFLLRGTRTVLRCLLELRAILDAHEVYYVYSRIWLDDFCRWIQACAREDTLKRLGDVYSVGWDLVLLEHTVQTAKERQPDSDDEDEGVESQRPALL